MQTTTPTETEYIVTYTRADALRDGVLIDVSEVAARNHWRIPVAVTAGLLAALRGIGDRFEALPPGLPRALTAAGQRLNETVRLDQRVPFVTAGGAGDVSAVVVIHRGDAAELVATVMLDTED